MGKIWDVTVGKFVKFIGVKSSAIFALKLVLSTDLKFKFSDLKISQIYGQNLRRNSREIRQILRHLFDW